MHSPATNSPAANSAAANSAAATAVAASAATAGAVPGSAASATGKPKRPARSATSANARASSAALAASQRPARMPDRMSLLGVPAGQLIAWQLILLAAAGAASRHGPAEYAFGAVAVLGFCLTVPRWRHRWAYQWLLTAWGFHRTSGTRASGTRASGTRASGTATSAAGTSGTATSAARTSGPSSAAPGSGPESPPRAWLPGLHVTPVRVRSGAEAGVVHDGQGFAVMIGVTPEPGGPPVTELPLAALAGLLDPQDNLVSAVQIVMHQDCAASDTTSVPASAYRNLGYHRMPRSQSAWVALRHDPVASGYAVGAAGSPQELHTSLLRSLAGRGLRTRDLLSDLGLRGLIVDAEAAREVLHRTLLTPEPGSYDQLAAQGGPSHRWAAWHSATRGHITYWLRQWPPAGIPVLQEALATVSALSVTTAVTATRGPGGRIMLTATVRVAIEAGAAESAVTAEVLAAALSCDARLVCMNGDHAAGVLATLPLGRGPATAAKWAGRHAEAAAGSVNTVLPVGTGGVVLGTETGDRHVAVPFFTAAGGTRAAVVGDQLMPRLLALRVLATGARLQVVTMQPAGWMKLRSYARLPSERMRVVRPGTEPPSDATSAAPWMIIDDTGSPAAAGSRPWQSVVTVPSEVSLAAGALSGLDAILLQRTTPVGAATVVAALGLPESSAEALQLASDSVVAVAQRGSVRFALLTPDQAERVVLAESLRAS
jgi:type VII secretion protein EccE